MTGQNTRHATPHHKHNTCEDLLYPLVLFCLVWSCLVSHHGEEASRFRQPPQRLQRPVAIHDRLGRSDSPQHLGEDVVRVVRAESVALDGHKPDRVGVRHAHRRGFLLGCKVKVGPGKLRSGIATGGGGAAGRGVEHDFDFRIVDGPNYIFCLIFSVACFLLHDYNDIVCTSMEGSVAVLLQKK